MSMIFDRGSEFGFEVVHIEPCLVVVQLAVNHEGYLVLGRVSLQVGAGRRGPCPGCVS
jgi:hypothetical protein